MRDDAWYPEYLDIRSGTIEIPHHQREVNTLHYFMASLGDLDPFYEGAYAAEYLTGELRGMIEWVPAHLVQAAIDDSTRGTVIGDTYRIEWPDEFSTSPCDCCGTGLYGQRHEFAVLGGEA